ncbi:MAG: hypothetical protein WBL05_07240 [Brooklawnia sp.]
MKLIAALMVVLLSIAPTASVAVAQPSAQQSVGICQFLPWLPGCNFFR